MNFILYSSECTSNTFGDSCSQPCTCVAANTVNCNNVNGSCTCKSGWNGTNCDEDINECLDLTICDSVPNSSCQNNNGGYDCVCDSGYTKNASNLCESKFYFSDFFLFQWLNILVIYAFCQGLFWGRNFFRGRECMRRMMVLSLWRLYKHFNDGQLLIIWIDEKIHLWKSFNNDIYKCKIQQHCLNYMFVLW